MCHHVQSCVVACHQELKDLVKRLLTYSPSQRLGSLKGGALDVKAHPWFNNFDWQAFEAQSMTAPYIPKVTASFPGQIGS